MIDALLDLFAGSSCLGCARPGGLLCSPCADQLPRRGIRVQPSPCPPRLQTCFATCEYDGLVRDLLLWHKERNALSLCAPLGHLLAGAIAALLEVKMPDDATKVLLTPVPSRRRVVRERGHDPVRRITLRAASILRGSGWPVSMNPILRQRFAVRDQSELDRAGRGMNLKDSIAIDGGLRQALSLAGRPVTFVLCDDILTTGATASECQRALEDSGLQVRGIATIAHTVKRHC